MSAFRGVSRLSRLLGRVAGIPTARCASSAALSQDAVANVYTKRPPPVSTKKPGQLSEEQLDQFFADGYVIVPSMFTAEEMKPMIAAVEENVDALASKLYSRGKIQDKCEKAGFYKRLSLLEEQFKGTAVIMVKMGLLPNAFRKFWSNERLLNVVEQMIGPDIAGHPVWNLRSKTPNNEQLTVPWHQDNAYLDNTAINTLQPTAWIPFLDATVETGCMQVVKGGHRLGKTATHTCCAGGTWYVDLDEAEMERSLGVDLKKDIVTCEVPFGGVLFLNNCVPHRSLENYSDKVRWSLDLRWQDPAKPNGFHGLKDCVVMRKKDDPNYVIQWEEFATNDRTKLQDIAMGIDGDEFDTTVHGPWMDRWEINNHNKHTDSMPAKK